MSDPTRDQLAARETEIAARINALKTVPIPPLLDEASHRARLADAKVRALAGDKTALAAAEKEVERERTKHVAMVKAAETAAAEIDTLKAEQEAISAARARLDDERRARRRAAAKSRLEHLAMEYRQHVESASGMLAELVHLGAAAHPLNAGSNQNLMVLTQHARKFTAPLFDGMGIDPDDRHIYHLPQLSEPALDDGIGERISSELEVIQ